ncbi:MAG: DUF262 domain-containing protein [Candidatus Gastranaerophilales bacterium]|nr:DUF262 domain-containing protein [Candidatus Gastranaerophilales bacterium]
MDIEIDSFNTELNESLNDNDLEGAENLKYHEDNSISIYPANIKIEQERYSVYELKRKYEDKKEILMDPDFQRGCVWTTKQKRELIESILMGIKLPSFYFAERKTDGKKIVVDGKQRLSTLFDFLNGEFSLSNLNIIKEAKGKFSDLDGTQQSKIEDYQLEINVIKASTPERVMLDIFDRINRGGTTLNNQEMRNALYQGKSTILLKELAESPIFREITEKSISPQRMKDTYVVLRFLTFYIWKTRIANDKDGNWIDYKSDMNDFLAKTMEYINGLDDFQIDELKTIFYRTMNNVKKVIPLNAFRLPPNPPKDGGKAFKRPVNMPLFDTVCYLLSSEIPENKINILKEKYDEILNNAEYIEAITSQVDNIKSINKRFDIIEQIKQEVLYA